MNSVIESDSYMATTVRRQEYLLRFVDLTIDLPEPGPELSGFMTEILAVAGLEDRLGATAGQHSGWMIELLAERSGMSLRDMQQMAHRLARVLALVPTPDPADSLPFDGHLATQQATLSVFALRWAAPDAYHRFMAGECDAFAAAAALVEALSLNAAMAARHSTALMLVAVLLTFGLGGRSEMDTERFEHLFVQAGVGDAAIAKDTKQMVDKLGFAYDGILFKSVIDYVELAAMPLGLTVTLATTQ